jgi:hydroxymethylglutaryl-CoA reductase
MPFKQVNSEALPLFEGFSKLTQEERYARLQAMGALTKEDVAFLEQGGIQNTTLANKLVENAIGYFQLPMGVATGFCIDNEEYVIPMAVEETSIIAALSKTAKWIRQHGSIRTHTSGTGIIGQIQVSQVKNLSYLTETILAHKAELILKANTEVAASMVQRGGGVLDLYIRTLDREDGNTMAVIHVLMDSCDAMGANILNQVLEYLKNPIEELTQEKVTMCILSNLNDQKCTHVSIEMQGIDPDLGQRLQEASLFAEMDPYRAATHNKGIMNGIDAVLIATGNDWRAVEAGVHAYAARDGQYKALSTWRYDGHTLQGTLVAPIIVGIKGGVTSVHPTAQMAIRMMRIHSANHLARLIGSVGLVQNLGALRALCTDGIIQGHMKLHIDNLVLVSGATESEIPILKKRLQIWLEKTKRLSLNHVFECLQEIRQSYRETTPNNHCETVDD